MITDNLSQNSGGLSVSNTALMDYECLSEGHFNFLYITIQSVMLLRITIHLARKAQLLSQEALAEKADIDRSYVGGIERGEHNLAVINLHKISNALGIKLSVLFVESEI